MGFGEKYDKLGCYTDLKMTELTSHGFKLEDEGDHEKCLHCEKAGHQDHDSPEKSDRRNSGGTLRQKFNLIGPMD